MNTSRFLQHISHTVRLSNHHRITDDITTIATSAAGENRYRLFPGTNCGRSFLPPFVLGALGEDVLCLLPDNKVEHFLLFTDFKPWTFGFTIVLTCVQTFIIKQVDPRVKKGRKSLLRDHEKTAKNCFCTCVPN